MAGVRQHFSGFRGFSSARPYLATGGPTPSWSDVGSGLLWGEQAVAQT